MKLLSLRLCDHDSNMSYFDGNSVRYYKSERSKKIKHHGYNNLWEWEPEAQRVFDFDINEIDEIAIVLDPWKHNLPADQETFFPSESYNKYFPARCDVTRVNHHYAHALGCWVVSDTEDFDFAIVIDGWGDLDISWSVFSQHSMIDIGTMKEHGSIGEEMAQAGRWLGIEAACSVDLAGKVMGIQAYGNYDQGFYDHLREYDMRTVYKIFDRDDWSRYNGNSTLANLTPLNWIRTVHQIVGEKIVDFFFDFVKSSDKILYSGGVAQNVIWNTELKKHFPNLVIPPCCNDEGLSLGGLEYLRKKHNLPKFEINNFPYAQSDMAPTSEASEETIKRAARDLANGKTVGWYQGNGEIGPRALGNRSILMDARIPNAKDVINKIKKRETYRPFGASILLEFSSEYFDGLPENPYMLYVGKFKEGKVIPGVCHIDNTCRVQTVDKNGGLFRRLLEEFYSLTKCPLLLNTSMNVAGEPLAGVPEDAHRVFNETELDVNVIGDLYYDKTRFSLG